MFSYCVMINHVHPVAPANDNLTVGSEFVDEIEKRIGVRVETRKPAYVNRFVPVFIESQQGLSQRKHGVATCEYHRGRILF